jgi:type I restriction enzyme S subunit
MNSLPTSEWSEVLISDAISEIQTGVSVNSENRRRGASEIGILKTSCISRGQFFPDEHKAVIADEVERVKTPLKKESILMSRMNTPNLVGEVGYVQHQHPDIYLPDRLWMFEGKEGTANTLFLSHLLSSDGFRQRLSDIATGTSGSMKNIPQRSFLQIPIHLPPLPEQKKIAEILSGIDRCITQVKRRIQKQNLINESLLSDIEDLRGHKIARNEATIGDIASKVGSGITPRGGSDTYKSEGITFIRSQNVLKMRLSLADAVKIPQHIHASMSGTRVQPNDILLNITGASIGRSAVVPDGIGEANVNQHVCIIRVKEICDPLFLCGWLNSESGQIAINSSQAGGNRQGLNFEQIRAMSIPLPPIHLQKQVSVALQASNSLVQLSQGKLDWLLKIKKALSSDLLSGRKSVSI